METGFELVKQAIITNTNEKIEFRWIAGGYDREISFQDFKDMLIKPPVKDENKKEIMSNLRNIFMDGGVE